MQRRGGVEIQGVRITRYMAFKLRPPREDHKHVPRCWPRLVTLMHRRDAMFEVVIHKDQRVQKVLVMHAASDQRRIRLPRLNACGLLVVVHESHGAVSAHIVTSEEDRHGVV